MAGHHRHLAWGGCDETGQGDGEDVGGGGHVVETVVACGVGLGGAQQAAATSGLIGQRHLGMGHAALFVHNRAGDAAACDRGGRDRNGEGLGGGGAGRVDHAQEHRVCAHIGGGGCAGEGSGAVGGGGEGEPAGPGGSGEGRAVAGVEVGGGDEIVMGAPTVAVSGGVLLKEGGWFLPPGAVTVTRKAA